MARSPRLALVDSLDPGIDGEIVDPLLMDDALFSDEDSVSFSRDEQGLDVDDVLAELTTLIDDAVDFMESELVPHWEKSEKFYAGESDVPIIDKRSRATETTLRDAVRSVKPNVMRVFTQSEEIIEYTPADNMDFALATIAEKQSEFANSMFWNCGGYRLLSDVTHNSILKRGGVVKTHRKTTLKEEFLFLSEVDEQGMAQLSQMPEVTIVSAEETGTSEPLDEMGTVTPLYRVEVAYRRSDAENRMESVDLTTFFVDDNATRAEDARVIGERSNITVGEALAMGLEYDDWSELDEYDAGMNTSSEEERTRRNVTKDGDTETVDDSGHVFLLTEVYARYDLDGTGIPQLYRFFLGGTSYEYIAHDRVSENPYSICNGDPLPNSFWGRDLMDVLEEDQNTQTSLLRAACDNAHMANNRRLAVHDTLVNMADVMNSALGAPIRFRSPGMIQEIGTESTLGSMLPLLQYLAQRSEIKAGVTNAAMGLDPDALQSTDKEAVRNTIQLAQGQIELFCRNIVETGLRPAFAKLLKLSIAHPQKGTQPNVLLQLFNPNMAMRSRVGMGTGNVEGRVASLQQVITQQKEIIAQYGPDNPLCNLNHVMKATSDLGKLMGLPNMGRYFNTVTPEMMQQLAAKAAEMAKANQPEPPSTAIALAEEIRGKSSTLKQQMENEQRDKDREANQLSNVTKLLMQDDLERDKMAQTVEIEQAKMLGGIIDKTEIAYQQEKERGYDLQKSLLEIHGQNVAAIDGKQRQQEPMRTTVPSAQPQQQPQMPMG